MSHLLRILVYGSMEPAIVRGHSASLNARYAPASKPLMCRGDREWTVVSAGKCLMKLRKNSILYKNKIPGYGTVRVLRCRLRGEKVRVLTVDRAAQSAVRAEEGDHRALLFDYMESFDWICRLLPDAGSFFMIGGGGFSYPRHFCSTWPDRRMDVAELRPEILSLARQ